MITEQDHSPPFILSNRQQILHLIFGEWQPLLALLGKHFDGLSRIAWTKATAPRCIEDCTQHFNCEVRCTWRFSPLEFRVSKPLNFKCRYACDRSRPGSQPRVVYRTGLENRISPCAKFRSLGAQHSEPHDNEWKRTQKWQQFGNRKWCSGLLPICCQ